jgi:hypothetical protein
MAVMLEKMYRALIAAGAPEREASEAATELAGYENEFRAVRSEIAEIRSDLKLLKWMVGTVIVSVLALLFKAFG